MLPHIRSVGLVLLGLLASTAPAMSQFADFEDRNADAIRRTFAEVTGTISK